MSANWFPLVRDLRHYQRAWLTRDVVAGLSVAAVQIPTAVAYAGLAGLPPEVGLYSSLLPLVAYAFFASSRQLIVGPDAATCMMVGAILLPFASGDPHRYLALCAALSLMVGMLMLLGGLVRLGFIVNFFARPILVGYLNGIALSIMAGQLGKFLGIAIENRDFLPSIVELIRNLSHTHLLTMAVGVGTLSALVVLGQLAPRVPAALVALTAAVVAVVGFGLGGSGVKLVGEVPAGWPVLGLPGLGYTAAQTLGVSAVGLVIVSFTSGMLTARSFASRRGYEVDANQEMRAFGVANLISGLSGGFAVTGADSRTAVNDATGGKTQIVSVVAALATGLVVLFLVKPLELLPQAALGAVLIFAAWGLLDFQAWRQLRRIDRFEFRLSVLTTAGVLLVGVLPGVVLAILLAIFQVFLKIYMPQDAVLGRVPGWVGYNDIALDPRSELVPNVILYRFDGPLLFFNAAYFKQRVLAIVSQAASPPRWFILSVESVTQLDTSGVQALKELYAEFHAQGIELLIARPKLYMRRYSEAMDLRELIGPENICPTVHSAVEAVEGRRLFEHFLRMPRPKGVTVIHSFCQRLPQPDGRDCCFLALQPREGFEILQVFTSAMELSPLADARSHIPAGLATMRPDWFAPRPSSAYEAWTTKGRPAALCVLRDKTDGTVFVCGEASSNEPQQSTEHT